MSNVAPDSVFSSRQGHEDNPNSISDDDNMEADDDESIEQTPQKKKPSKCKNLLQPNLVHSEVYKSL